MSDLAPRSTIRAVTLVVAIAATFLFAAPAFGQFRRGISPAPHPPVFRARPVVPIFLPPRFLRFRMPFNSFVIGSGLQGAWWPGCGLALGWSYNCGIMPVPPIYFYGLDSIHHPRLALKDGTIYTVNDYWLVDNQLHFVTTENAKTVEHVIGFDQLDVQKTVDLDAQLGFRFVLRNEPLDQYIKDHPNFGSPSELPSVPGPSQTPPQSQPQTPSQPQPPLQN
jgi:hypothetical protein